MSALRAPTNTLDDRATEWLREALGLSEVEKPFAWQLELLRRYLDNEHVEALDIPTGLGKTAVMAIWLVARACGAAVPRRLVYVVDRRAVVDQASEVAERLRALVERHPMRSALRLTGRLPISTLRGQHVDNREWLDDPSVPAIVVGTVDMIGSRLLFGGYGVSRKMRPYHAGLLGSDALIVLDEAHLAQPFERLLEQIARGVAAKGSSLRPEASIDRIVPRFRTLSLSATGRERAAGEVLRLTDADRRSGGVAAKRLNAPKWLSIRTEVHDKELPEALAAEAWTLVSESALPARVIVFCDGRDHAQKVREALENRFEGPNAPDVELFVGGRRVHERQEAAARLCELGFVAGSPSRPERSVFVVATSAGEVGVDLDADHAVCDLVAWERMIQRFGRVNRRGEGEARIVVVPTRGRDEREVSRRQAVREALEMLSTGETIDVSLAALLALKERGTTDDALQALLERATTPAPLHPPLTRALVEAWSMTSLWDHTGRPEVAPWIRGWPDEEEEPQTTLVWRRYLPVTLDGHLLPKREFEMFREAADPHLAERLDTETWRAMAWLEKRVKTLAKSSTAMEHDGAEAPLQRSDVLAVIVDMWDGGIAAVRANDLSTSDARKRLAHAMEGATVLLDRRIGGLREGLLADDEDAFAPDVTEIEAEGGARFVPFRVSRHFDDEERTPSVGWRTEAIVPVRTTDDGETAWLVIESVAEEAAESEEGRSTAGRAQSLTEHEAWTEEEAANIAKRLELPDEYAELLTTAALLHDEGKKASRWQRAFRVPAEGGPYAKSATSRPNITHLEGYRHELGSLPYAEAHPRVKAMPEASRELCLHVIAAHHGSARPTIRTNGAEEPPMLLAKRAKSIALRFSALEKRWGPWGLAWWEALLRAADQRASRRNDERGNTHG